MVGGSRPRRVFVIGADIRGFYAVRAVYVISPFDSFIHGFLDRHRFSPCTSSSCVVRIEDLILRPAITLRETFERFPVYGVCRGPLSIGNATPRVKGCERSGIVAAMDT